MSRGYFCKNMDLTTPFPLPPPHYNEFTSDYKTKSSIYTKPPTPILGPFPSFGQIDDINFEPKLASNIPSLDFELPNKKDQLKEINKRLRLRFLDLLESLSNDTQGVVKVNRLWIYYRKSNFYSFICSMA